jgi:hypothetical protein
LLLLLLLLLQLGVVREEGEREGGWSALLLLLQLGMRLEESKGGRE